ncbi:hypothetical protein [Aestuariivita boseongensis]|uniref:hypothetical protein n=1 Tax=Aestuariivita boseongensis TaxID=1470562 RepID=UPI0006821534|nr:hypothetical protein [Aestuariivita boseongensis]
MLMRARSLLLTALIALGLIASGQAMASAKGASPATGYMVICNGQGATLVFTDKDGHPTSPQHLCPDCVLAGLMAMPDPDAPSAARPAGVSKAAWPQTTQQRPAQIPANAQARGPPIPV